MVSVIKSIPLLDILKSRSVVETEEIGTSETTGVKGVNRAFKVSLSDGKNYIWKDKEGEHISKWRFVPPKTLYKREYVADLVDNQLGFNLVPKTKIVKKNGKIGSLQEWVESAVPADTSLESYSLENIWKAGLLDLIIGNLDRHSGNWGTKDHFPVLWDNGFAFPNFAESKNPKSIILSRFAFRIWDKNIPQRFLEDIKRLKEISFQEKLTEYLDKDSLILFNERVNELLKGIAKFPKYKIVEKLNKAPK